MSTHNDTDLALIRWAYSENLNNIVRFHDSLQSLLAEQLRKPEISADSHLKETVRRYDEMNSTNSFLVTFGFLEEMLLLAWKDTLRGKKIVGRGLSERFKPLFIALGVSVGDLPAWSFLLDAAEIRNCLLHAHGRVSLMQKPDAVRACIARLGRGVIHKNDRLAVSSVFLRRFVTAVRGLRDVLVPN